MGRPPNSGKYRESTDPLRVPVSAYSYMENLIDTIWLYIKFSPSKEKIIHEIFQRLIQEVFKVLREIDSRNKNLLGIKQVKFRTLDNAPQKLPKMYGSAIAATFGVTSTGEQDNPGEEVDLHELLVKKPEKTIVVKVAGDSMNRANINHDDLLIVRKLEDPWSELRNGTVVVASVDQNQTVKRFEKEKGKTFLRPDSDNEEHKEIELKPGKDIEIIGVVLYSIHTHSAQLDISF